MCGIIALHNRSATGERVIKVLRKTYEKQKLRGSDSFGIAVQNPGGVLMRVRGLKVEQVLNPKTACMIGLGAFVIFHNRAATSTAVDELLTHPFISEDGQVALIHNGIVSNYEEKRRALQKKGHRFESAHKEKTVLFFPKGKARRISAVTSNVNDSEVLLHTYEEEGIRGCIDYSIGSVAVAIIDLRGESLVLARNSSPVEYHNYGEFFIAASQLKHGKTLPYGAVITARRDGSTKVEQVLPMTLQTPLNSSVWKDYDGEDGWDARDEKRRLRQKEALFWMYDKQAGSYRGWEA